jgi:hypothetical protein
MYWVATQSRVDVLDYYTVKGGCIGLLHSQGWMYWVATQSRVDVSGGGGEGDNLKDLEVK